MALPNDTTGLHEDGKGPADMTRFTEGAAPEATPYAKDASETTHAGAQEFVVMENDDTGETHVAPDGDVSNPYGEGFDEARVHDTPDDAERDANAAD